MKLIKNKHNCIFVVPRLHAEKQTKTNRRLSEPNLYLPVDGSNSLFCCCTSYKPPTVVVTLAVVRWRVSRYFDVTGALCVMYANGGFGEVLQQKTTMIDQLRRTIPHVLCLFYYGSRNGHRNLY